MDANLTIGFVGAGNMARALIGAVIASGIAPPANITAADASPAQRDAIQAEFGVRATPDNGQVFCQAGVAVMAVKPQVMAEVLQGIARSPGFGAWERKIVISIAAGIPIAAMEKILYANLDAQARERTPIIRVMPNTPALVGQGMAGMAGNSNTTSQDRAVAEKIMAAAGKARWFEEKDINAVTALSGSGPAYVFYLAEAMIRGGVEAGLPEEDARAMAVQTIKGAAALMEQTGEAPDSLRKKVTSKGGTTEAALAVFESRRVGPSIVEGVLAAKKRGEELAG